MGFGDRELAAAFGGPGTVAILIGGTTIKGFKDEDSADVLTAGGEFTAEATRRSVLVRSADLPATLAVDDTIKIDGQNVVVRGFPPVDDGALKRLVYVPA